MLNAGTRHFDQLPFLHFPSEKAHSFVIPLAKARKKHLQPSLKLAMFLDVILHDQLCGQFWRGFKAEIWVCHVASHTVLDDAWERGKPQLSKIGSVTKEVFQTKKKGGSEKKWNWKALFEEIEMTPWKKGKSDKASPVSLGVLELTLHKICKHEKVFHQCRSFFVQNSLTTTR